MDRLIQSFTLTKEKKITKLTITIPGQPKPQGSKTAFVNKSTGKVTLVEASKGLKAWRIEAANLIKLEAQAKGWIQADAKQPVVVSIVFELTHPKAPKNPNWPVGVPDLDKLARSCLDAITQAGNVWWDDSQVIKLSLVKVWRTYGDEARTIIRIQVD
jgi:Holliday junction resolvase RusA-like endonuclease